MSPRIATPEAIAALREERRVANQQAPPPPPPPLHLCLFATPRLLLKRKAREREGALQDGRFSRRVAPMTSNGTRA